MQSLFDAVEKELPLTFERETDCRDTWPKRWALLKAKVEKLTAHNSDYTAALRVWKEFCAPSISMSCGKFGVFCEQRLNSAKKPNCA